MKRATLENLELQIAMMLRIGVLLSGVLMFVGWIAQFQISENPFAQFQVYKDVSFLQNIHQMQSDSQWGLLLCYAGLVILVALPCLRVLLTYALFIRLRDYRMAAITSIVLTVLLYSFTQGIQ